jgi:hypothetical protein
MRVSATSRNGIGVHGENRTCRPLIVTTLVEVARVLEMRLPAVWGNRRPAGQQRARRTLGAITFVWTGELTATKQHRTAPVPVLSSGKGWSATRTATKQGPRRTPSSRQLGDHRRRRVPLYASPGLAGRRACCRRNASVVGTVDCSVVAHGRRDPIGSTRLVEGGVRC